MAHINDCVPGTRAKLVRAGVPRVVGKVGMIVEVARVKRRSEDPVVDTVTVEVPGHGDIVVPPGDLEIVA
jgi:hypothetical protein